MLPKGDVGFDVEFMDFGEPNAGISSSCSSLFRTLCSSWRGVSVGCSGIFLEADLVSTRSEEPLDAVADST